MNVRDYRIGTRLGFGFGSILLILAALIVSSNVLTARNKAQLGHGMDQTSAKARSAADMRSAMLETGIAMRNIGLQPDPAWVQKEVAKVKALRARYDAAHAQIRTLGLDDDERKLLAQLDAVDHDIDAAFNEALAQAHAGNAAGVTAVLASRIDPLSGRALGALGRLVGMQHGAMKAVQERSRAADHDVLVLTVALGVTGLVVGIGCAVFTTRSITVPLNSAVEVAQRVAAGELTSRVAVEGRDETSALLQALKDMNDSLVRTVGQVRGGTDTIARASQEIAAGNADLSARTEAQAGSLGETATSMGTLTSTVRQNADNARQANQLAVSASSVAEKGGTVVSQVVETMGSIKASSSKIVDIA